MESTDALWAEIQSEIRTCNRLYQVASVLNWDQQTYLPEAGGESRAEQLALILTLLHERGTRPRLGEALAELATRDLDPVRVAAVKNLKRDFDRATRVPAALVERLARLQGLGHVAWMEARAERSFARFAPILAELVDASLERARAVDPTRPAYDVLIDEFEPDTTTAALTATFGRLRQGLQVLLDRIRGAEPLPRLVGRFDPAKQMELAHDVARALGYDLRAGRLDLAPHPFTTNLGPGDVRITLRTDPDDVLNLLGGTTHEVGHAMYEQGIPHDPVGVDRPASMGLHESQSRFWENAIGRSLPFFRWLQGPLRARFGDAPSAEALYRAANRVEPGPIRVLADEVTYNLHVIVRFELEQALFDGRLRVPDLRDAWNEAYRSTLGVDPKDDVEGVLQDIHWSGASFGYFPTYTLGNLYAAAFARKIRDDLPDLWGMVERGEFGPILGWLRENLHRHGGRWPAPELVAQAVGTGDPIAADPVEALLTHLWERQGALHGVRR
jgi:carboxypeptidase Taq